MRLSPPVTLLSLALLLPAAVPVLVAGEKPPKKPAAFYKPEKVWEITLTFTPEEYAALEPKGGGGGPGGPGGFGPGKFLSSLFLQGDADHDGQLTRSEYLAQAERWFTAWDTEKAGRLTAEQLRTGLGSALRPGGPGGGPGGRGPGGGMSFVAAPGLRNGMSGVSGINFEYVHGTLNLNGEDFPDVALRYKGNATFMSSRGSLKRSFKVDLSKYAKAQSLAGVEKLNLHSDAMSPTWLDESLSFALYREAEVPAPRTTYARVWIAVPGKYEHQYAGLYSVVEEIDKHTAKEMLGSGKTAIFKPVGALFKDLGNEWPAYEKAYDPKTELTAAQQQRVIDFARLVTSASDEEFARQLGDFLDLEEFSRYMAVTAWVATMDSILAMGQNFYVVLDPKTNRFRFVPWDLDQSFGGGPGGNGDPVHLSVEHPWTNENRFLERVFKVEAFHKLYREHLAEFCRTIFTPERLQKQAAATAAAIRPAIEAESKEKLARFDQLLAPPTGEKTAGAPEPSPAPEPPARRDEGPGGFGPPGMGRGRNLTAFLSARTPAVLAELSGHPMPASPGGEGRPGGPGGPGGPGRFLAEAWRKALDTDHDGAITQAEFTEGLTRWFDTWDTAHTGTLTEARLQAGLAQTFPMPGPGGSRREERP